MYFEFSGTWRPQEDSSKMTPAFQALLTVHVAFGNTRNAAFVSKTWRQF